MLRYNIDEDVNGVVIGGFTKRVMVVSPRGRIEAEGNIPCGDSATVWGLGIIEGLREQRTGDGKTLREHGDIFRAIYGAGKFEIREYY